MELSQQVISLEYAKRLKELGVRQDSLFYYIKNKHTEDCLISDEYPEFFYISKERIKISHGYNNTGVWDVYSAFTVAELGEMLPSFLENPDEDDQVIKLCCAKCESEWDISYSYSYFILSSKTEANARAKMLTHLLENGLMEISK